MVTWARRAAALALLGVAAWSASAHPWGWLYGFGLHPYPESSSTPWTYQMWSGIVPALTVLSLIGAIITSYRRAECHVHSCWRIAKFPVAGGQYKVCIHHHPDHGDNGHVTFEQVLSAHRSHKAAAAAWTAAGKATGAE